MKVLVAFTGYEKDTTDHIHVNTVVHCDHTVFTEDEIRKIEDDLAEYSDLYAVYITNIIPLAD